VIKDITSFVSLDSTLPKLIVIYGPTASGKTSVSIDIAKQLDTQIISADSRQIYRMMDIGTAKVTEQEMDGVAHHMIDIRDPDESYSVGEWVQDVEPIIDDLHAKGVIPVICGGTGLYIDALIHQFDIPEVFADQELRDKLELYRQEHGNDALWQRLEGIDPEYASELHPNNYHYVVRAIEVYTHTGKSKKELKVKKSPKYDVKLITPFEGERDELYSRINARVDMMFTDGLVQEVESILRQYKVESTKVEDILTRLP